MNQFPYNPYYDTGAKTLSGAHHTASTPIDWTKPLPAPMKQSIVPVINKQTANTLGWLLIATTTFQGTETTLTLPSGVKVDLGVATLPQRIVPGTVDGVPHQLPPQSFMAVPIDHESEINGWYMSPSEWRPNREGTYYMWSMAPTQIRFQNHQGQLWNAVDMGRWILGTAPAPTPDPDPVDGTLRWACAVSKASLDTECPFFDFPWMDVFKAGMPTGSAVEPKKILVVSNPTSGEFKATIVQAPGGAQVVPGGGLIFNTVRILKMKEVAPGDYTFNFSVVDSQQNKHPVVLTLTVPTPV